MELSEAIADQAVSASNFNGTGSDITTKTGKRLINFGAEVTPVQIEAMKSGPFYFYEGVTIVSSDENAKRENVLYYAEGCLFYERRSQVFNQCHSHVTTKAIYHPFKSEQHEPSQSPPAKQSSRPGQIDWRYWPLIWNPHRSTPRMKRPG